MVKSFDLPLACYGGQIVVFFMYPSSSFVIIGCPLEYYVLCYRIIHCPLVVVQRFHIIHTLHICRPRNLTSHSPPSAPSSCPVPAPANVLLLSSSTPSHSPFVSPLTFHAVSSPLPLVSPFPLLTPSLSSPPLSLLPPAPRLNPLL